MIVQQVIRVFDFYNYVEPSTIVASRCAITGLVLSWVEDFLICTKWYNTGNDSENMAGGISIKKKP